MKINLTPMNSGIYFVSDKAAGFLAKNSPGNGGKLPKIGYVRTVIHEARKYDLQRYQTLPSLDPAKVTQRKRSWVWTLRPLSQTRLDALTK